jgi:hypothetical protein
MSNSIGQRPVVFGRFLFLKFINIIHCFSFKTDKKYPQIDVEKLKISFISGVFLNKTNLPNTTGRCPALLIIGLSAFKLTTLASTLCRIKSKAALPGQGPCPGGRVFIKKLNYSL